MSDILIRVEPLGGGALARAAIAGQTPPAWYRARPVGIDAWTRHVEEVRREFAASDWLGRLAPAIAATDAARERLRRVSEGRGVLVTTGQQPGLFGGAMLAVTKALSALALADEIERATGVPAAPLFWAATDDADFAEAASTVIATVRGAERITMTPVRAPGAPMSAMPLGDVSAQFDALRMSAGSVADDRPLSLARHAYRADATVGSAYLELLRGLLAPLGIPVLDASDPAVRDAAHASNLRALERADIVARAVAERTAEITAAGYEPQVREVEGLAHVSHITEAEKRRIRIADAARFASAPAGELGPNVLLRPVVERAILPTVVYLAGPGELSYFAQASAVAEALDLAVPLVAPRCSLTVVEPHVAAVLRDLRLELDALRAPDVVEGIVARRALPTATAEALATARREITDAIDRVRGVVASHGPQVPARALVGVEGAIAHRIDRLERRLLAAAKRDQEGTLARVAMARGALFPFGAKQERKLNVLPMLARRGSALLDEMLAAMNVHARELVRGAAVDAAVAGAAAGDARVGAGVGR